MKNLDWPALMQAGMQRLQLLPADFWALTPAELYLMLGIDSGLAPINRRRLNDLLAKFPDTSQAGE
ncbi:hypothetical protein RB2150_04268 [Rhodobacterales bacterium HTCC2150]|nr:hypothetical protein RB2150_04268 [Rhodobacterales bacterium HTCC2150] [Rhodobacteraceae bacterium HTCC2150]